MATITAAQMADNVALTLADLGRLKFQQIYQELPHYEVLSKWLKRDRVQIDSGNSIQRNIMIRDASTSASHVGLLDEDQVDIQDVMRTLSVDWVHAQTSWAIVYQSDVLMNSGKSMIENVIKPRRAKALIDLAQELEDKAWAAPSSTDSTLPYGIPYWVVKNATQGFTGGAPAGFTTVGGINPEVDTRWKNYSGTYSGSVTKTGAIKTLRTAKRQTGFVSPVSVKDYRGKIGQRYRLYVNETTISEFEDTGEAQNESLGRDIASMDGTIVFRGHPIIWVAKLDSDTDNPIYFVDHSTFSPHVLRGDYLRESDAQKAPNQHNVFQIFVDLSYQYLCVDRRRNAVIYKV